MPTNVLIVEDDHVYAERIIAPHFKEWFVKMAHNVPQSIRAANEMNQLSLAIVDLDIPGGKQDSLDSGGAGFEVIDVLQEKFPGSRIIILSAHLSPGLINLAQRRGVEYIVKGNCKGNLKQIASSLESRNVEDQLPSVHVAIQISQDSGLTTKQQEILVLAVRGFSRVEIAQEMDITDSTFKTHLTQVLRKTQFKRFEDLLRMISKRAQTQPCS